MAPFLKKLVYRLGGVPQPTDMAPGEDAEAETANQANPSELPHLLLFGSLIDCSKKDAVAYCEGLLDRNVTAKTVSGYRIMPHPAAKERDVTRWAFEIHEGGCGQSYLEAVIARTLAGETLRLPLQQGRVVEVFEHAGELISLIYPAEAAESLGACLALDELANKQKIRPFLGTGRPLAMAAVGLAVFSFAAFSASAVAYYRANLDLTADHVLLAATGVGKDNIATQLQQAKRQATSRETYVAKLEFAQGKWSWTLGNEKPKTDNSAPTAATLPHAPEPPAPPNGTPGAAANPTSGQAFVQPQETERHSRG